ncbi:protein kinase domain-containing protein [Stratiformator vulcanicus]|uniref:Serine/threonine-protein kinase StkP n=1 Tax=Stratiformator vulcanicus TaxID=2527980 RepID=A0A517R2K8_9PLAN|nr:protein kinase [Stratiformator vulcanicus]QDT38098.1 Serine/threonine-protein kinase StkP [Stratiformator vulcanicus]
MSELKSRSDSATRMGRISDVCEQYRRLWKSGAPPSLSRFLGDLPDSEQPVLLSALLPIEFSMRRETNNVVDRAKYLREFPEYAHVINDFFRDEETRNFGEAGETTEPKTSGEISMPHTIGRYKIVRKIGEGGMGAVFLAYDPDLDRSIAIKVPHTEQFEADSIDRFRREARAAAGLQHPGICPVFDIGRFGNHDYIAMAFVDGDSLEAKLKKLPTPPSQLFVIKLTKAIADALVVAHSGGVVHRDLKPANIMLDPNGRPVIMDFGLAMRMHGEAGARTRSGQILGTPSYMSPEQVDGDPLRVGPAADVYGLGVILYRMLAGSVPFAGSLMAVLKQVANDQPRPLSEIRPDVDPDLAFLCMSMLEKSSGNRPQMVEVSSQLLRIGRSLASSARTIPPRERALAPRKLQRGEHPQSDPETSTSGSGVFNWNRLKWVAAGGMAFLFLLAAITIRFKTEDGEYVVQTDSNNAQIEFDGNAVSISDGETRSVIEFKPATAPDAAVPQENAEVAPSAPQPTPPKIEPHLPVQTSPETSPVEVSKDRPQSLPDVEPIWADSPKALTPPSDEANLARILTEKGALVGVTTGSSIPKWINAPDQIPSGKIQIVGLTLSRGLPHDTFAAAMSCPNLKYLSAGSVVLGDQTARLIGSARNLEMLDLQRSPISDDTIAAFSELKELATLNLGYTRMTAASAHILDNMPELTTLQLHQTQLGDAGAIHFRKLKKLERLYVDGTGMTDRAAEIISSLAQLQTLYVSSSSISDEGLRKLSELKKLRSLSLPLSGVSDEGVRSLAGHRNLESIELVGTSVTGKTFDVLAQVPLKRIQLRGCPVDSNGLGGLLRHADSLEMLGLFDTKLGEQDIPMLGKFKALKSLAVVYNNDRFTRGAESRLKAQLPGCRIE